MSYDIKLQKVETKKQRRDFVGVPKLVFQGDPNWRQTLTLERLWHIDPKKNPYFDHANVALWTASKNGEAVGRISAQINHLHLDRHQDGAGHFGMLDAIDDENVFQALFETAESWLLKHGVRRAVGPYSLSVNEEIGTLISGFDTPPYIMMNHAKPYYQDYIEKAGYSKVKDLISYDFPLSNDPLPPRSKKMVQRLFAKDDFVIRHINMKNFHEEVRMILEIFNDAWSDNWSFVPMTEAEITHMAKDMKPMILEDACWIIEDKGTPVAFSLAIPNLNEIVADFKGRLLPFNWAKLLYRLRFGSYRSARMPLMGVKKKYQNTLLGPAMAFAVIEKIHMSMKARGIVDSELSWILEDNTAINTIILNTGAKPYKTYRMYEKALT